MAEAVSTDVRLPAADRASYRRLVVASSLGTAIEWYDFFLYGLIGPLVFDVLMFPKLDPLVGTIAVFSSFAIGFLARPLGGIFFGHFGDKVGRKSVLLATIFLMGLSTAGIGLLPTYAQVGIWAPLLLVLLRFLQGFALGGESIGALLLTLESAPQDRRGFYASLIQAAGPIGVIGASLATTMVADMDQEALMSWGWRVPFLISFVLVLIGAYIRSNVEESPVFAHATVQAEVPRVPLFTVLRQYSGPTLGATLFCMAETAFFYLTSIFAISYGAKTLGIEKGTLTQAFLIANCVALGTVPLFGMAADRFGRRTVFIAGVLAAAAYIYPFLLLMATRDPVLVTLAIVCASGVIHPIMFAPEASFVAELFDTQIRFSGASTGKQIGTVLGGGLAPLAATGLLAWSGGSSVPIAAYFIALAVVALIALALLRETRGQKL